MTKTTKAIKGHIAAVKAGSVTNTNIIGMRKAINGLESGRGVNGLAVSGLDVDHLFHAVCHNRPLITGDLEAKGLKALRARIKSKALRPVADIIEDFDRFLLVDLKAEGLGRSTLWYPVYRLVSRRGDFFDFHTVPWQYGGNGPEVGLVWRKDRREGQA